MPQAIIKGKLVRVPHGQKLPASKGKRKIKKISDSAPQLPSEKDWMYQPVLLKGEKIISFRKTRVTKDRRKIISETEETPYGKISTKNDDLKIDPLRVRRTSHTGRLFLTNKRLVHVIRHGEFAGLRSSYTVDFDQPLSTLLNVATEISKKDVVYRKRLGVQYCKGDVDMFGDIILAKRDGAPVVETFKERKPIEITREKRKRLVLLDERKPVAVPEREEAFKKRGLPEKRRFHVFGNVDEFAKKIKIAAGIE